MAKLFNLARMTTATTGTGTLTLGAAVAGYLTFALAGVANADVVAYAISDGANSEAGTGTYTSAGTTLTRTVVSSTNGNAAISLSGTAQVFITALQADIANLRESNIFTGAGNSLTLSYGADNTLKLGRNTSNTAYNTIGLNGNIADTTNIGMTGGGSGDGNLYVNATADIVLRPTGSAASPLRLNSTVLFPGANDGMALGTGANSFSDLFLASGGIINFNNGDVTVSHGADSLSVGGITSFALNGVGSMVVTIGAAGTCGIEIGRTDGTAGTAFMDWHSSATTVDYDVRLLVNDNGGVTGSGSLALDGAGFRPNNNDQASLGNVSQSWSDLFLASGGVINWNAGNTILTQSSNALALSGSGFMSLTISAASSTTTNPAAFGVSGGWASGTAARWFFGDKFNGIQNAFGARTQIYGYHGIEIIGATANQTTTPTFVTGGAAADSSLAVYGTTAATLAVGRQGPTNPAFAVDSAAATVVTGVKVAGAAAAGRAFLSVLSTGTDEGLNIDAKGAGTIRLGAASTGAIEHSRNAVPTASDGAALGTTALMWSDLFLASGGFLNFNNGNYTLTHAAGSLTAAGGAFIAPCFTVNAATNPTNGINLPAANCLGFFANNALRAHFNGATFVMRNDGGTGTFAFDGFTPNPQIVSNFQDTVSLALGAWIAGNSSARIMFGKSRNGTLGTNTACTSGEHIGEIQWCMADGASTLRRCAELRVEATGTASTTSVPTKMFFVTTPSASVTPADALTLDQAGAVRHPRIGTTATAGNAFLDSADANNMLRSTSSIRYKTNVTDIPQDRIDAIKNLRLVEFSSLANMDNPESRFIGLVAEDVAAVDPNLVIYGYDESDLEFTAKGALVPKPGARQKPDGVQYDRVLLLQIAALQQRITALESRRT